MKKEKNKVKSLLCGIIITENDSDEVYANFAVFIIVAVDL